MARKLVLLICLAIAGCGEGSHTLQVTPTTAQVLIWDSDGKYDVQHVLAACRAYRMLPKSWQGLDDDELAVVDCAKVP